MERTTPVSNGWMTLVRPLGTIFPVADATMSIVPHQAQTSAAQNSRMMVTPIARPIGDGGVSTISSAAGRKASSSPRRWCVRRNGMTRRIGLACMAGSADFKDASLQPMQRCIATACSDQRVVGAVLDQAAVLERNDAIQRPHGREPMRDDQNRPPLCDLLHVLLDDTLALIVEGARRLIEDQNARVGDERAGNGDALSLATREGRAALADDRVVAFGQLEDEFVRPRKACRRDDALHRHRWVGERDILADRAVEQHVLLQDDANLAAQPGRVDHGEIHAVDQDAPALRDVEALDELGERALARPRRPDDADHLPGRHIEGDIVQDFLSVNSIAERYMVEVDVAADRRQPRARRHIGRLGSGVEDVAEPQDRQARLVKVLPNLRETQHRRAHAAGQDVKAYELAYRQAAFDNQLGTEIEDAGGDDLVDELHDLARGVAEA